MIAEHLVTFIKLHLHRTECKQTLSIILRYIKLLGRTQASFRTRFTFSSPPLGDLGATYDDHLSLIGKRVVDFLLVLIELFC